MNSIRTTLLGALAGAAILPLLLVGASPAAAATPPGAAGAHLAGVTLTLSHPEIYPVHDGYRDSLGISVAKTVTGASGPVALTGSVTITHGTKTVVRFPVTTSATQTYAWSGRVAGTITTGTYSVTAKVIAPNATVTRHATVVVSRHRLRTHVKEIDVPAQQFFQDGYSATSGGNGCVATTTGAITCSSTRGGHVAGSNYVEVPASVYRFAGYRPYTARVSVTVSHVTVIGGRHTYWEWNGAHRYRFAAAGTHTTASSPFGADRHEQRVAFRVSSGSKAEIDQVAITYVYAVLG